MGKSRNGILGDISGTVGTVTGSKWRGIYFIRNKTKKYSFVPTPKQVIHRNRFTACSKFISSIRYSIIDPIWEPDVLFMNGFDLFMKTNLYAFDENGILTGFSKLKLSIGKLPLPKDIQISIASVEERIIKISWNKNPLNDIDAPTDKLSVVFLNGITPVIIREQTFSRINGEAIITIPKSAGDQVNTYIFFENADGTCFSESTWFFIEF